LKVAVTHPSLVQGSYTGGESIIIANPLFVDAKGADNIAGTDADTTEHPPVDLQANQRITDMN
jgi:hypothetical protein